MDERTDPSPGPAAPGASFASARRTILAAVSLTFAGSVLGLTVGRLTGALAGSELWLVAATGLFSAALLVILLRRPFDTIPWIAPLSSWFFLVYLVGGALLSVGEPTVVDSFMTYLLWFFPLLVFNRFVNVSAGHMALSWLIYVSAIGMALSRMAVSPVGGTETPLLVIYCLACTSFTLMLDLFARYREAYLRSEERSFAMTHLHAQMSQREAQFRHLFSNAPAGIGWIGMDGRCQSANVAFCRMTGRSEQDLAGLPFEELVCTDSRTTWKHAHERLISGSVAQIACGLQMSGSDGRSTWTQTSFALATEADGAAQSMAFVCLDDTASRDAAARVLQGQRLEAVGQLTGGVAHDFNNLLTVVIGNAEMLSEELADREPALARVAEMTLQAAQRGADLTRNLLSFARKNPLMPQLVDINVLVQGMVPLLRKTLGEHIEIAFAPSTDACTAFVDPSQFDSAVLNLSLNARDAMADGGRLSLATAVCQLEQDERVDVSPGTFVVLSVSDTGIGIAATDLARVFEPFFTTKGSAKGSGLGLSMVYGFVKQSGGHAEIVSELGRGTTVRLFIPSSDPWRTDEAAAAMDRSASE